MKKNAVVIGYGGMGGWHTRYLRESDAVNLLGVYDINPARNAAAKEAGIHAYPSWRQSWPTLPSTLSPSLPPTSCTSRSLSRPWRPVSTLSPKSPLPSPQPTYKR